MKMLRARLLAECRDGREPIATAWGTCTQRLPFSGTSEAFKTVGANAGLVCKGYRMDQLPCFGLSGIQDGCPPAPSHQCESSKGPTFITCFSRTLQALS